MLGSLRSLSCRAVNVKALVVTVAVLVTSPWPYVVPATIRSKVIDQRDANPRIEDNAVARRYYSECHGFDSQWRQSIFAKLESHAILSVVCTIKIF